jgi:hypothetical protein
MTLKIERSTRCGFAVLTLSGRIEEDHIPGLMELIRWQSEYPNIRLDMKEVKLVDREAVKFLARCEADGAKLENCPVYIRKWMERERD